MKIINLVLKNFKLLLRSKTSALIIFIGPLLLVSLLGMAFSHSSTFVLTASTYSPSYSDLSESLVTKMKNQNFRVLRQDSLENCISSVKRSESQACILFPPGMKLGADKTNKVTFYVDYGQIDLVWLILDVMEARVSERNTEITKDLTKDLLDRLWYVKDRTNTGKGKLDFLKQSVDEIKDVASGAKLGVKGIDLNVSFDANIDDSEKKADEILLLVGDVETDVQEAFNEISASSNTISSAASSLRSEAGNDTTMLENLDKINEELDKIDTKLSDLRTGTDNNNVDMTTKVGDIKKSLSSVKTSFEDAKQKVENMKKQKDQVVPRFNNLTTDIENLLISIDGVDQLLDQILLKIDALQITSPDKIVNPITTEIKPISIQRTHYNNLFPGLLVIIIMITGILLGTTLVSVEKKSKAFFRNNIVPTSYFTFSLATYFTALSALFIQLLIFISVSAFFFETEVLTSLSVVALIIFLASTVFIVVGMFMGFLFRTEATATLASITLGSLFMLFSNLVIPLEALSEWMKQAVQWNPFVIAESALRQSLLFNLPLAKMAMNLGVLAGYAVGIFLLLVILQGALRRLAFIHFRKTHEPQMVKEKKAAKKLVPDISKVENPANELLIKSPEEAEAEISGKQEKK